MITCDILVEAYGGRITRIAYNRQQLELGTLILDIQGAEKKTVHFVIEIFKLESLSQY